MMGETGRGWGWLGACLLLGIGTAVAHAEDSGLRSTVDEIVGPSVQARAIPGLVVGVSWHGQRSYYSFGPEPMNDQTIVEIGSITKVVTTALFAEAVMQGRMRLDTPLQSSVPFRLKPCTDRITALELADYTSGLPSIPGDAPENLQDRGIGHYTTQDFLRWVADVPDRARTRCDVPSPYRYSNAGVGLLGYMVADRLGAPWADLVRDRVTGPLRMTSTAVKVPEAERGRLATGHLPNGSLAQPWPVFAWFAAGALRSSAADMLSFGEAALGHATVEGRSVPPLLRDALQVAMRPIYTAEDQTFDIGMAWFVSPGNPAEGLLPVTYKVGGTDGFNSVIVINPGKDLAIFIAANKSDTGIGNLGVTLSRHIR